MSTRWRLGDRIPNTVDQCKYTTRCKSYRRVCSPVSRAVRCGQIRRLELGLRHLLSSTCVFTFPRGRGTPRICVDSTERPPSPATTRLHLVPLPPPASHISSYCHRFFFTFSLAGLSSHSIMGSWCAIFSFGYSSVDFNYILQILASPFLQITRFIPIRSSYLRFGS